MAHGKRQHNKSNKPSRIQNPFKKSKGLSRLRGGKKCHSCNEIISKRCSCSDYTCQICYDCFQKGYCEKLLEVKTQ